MPKVNPLANILKKLASLQTKGEKLNQEIGALVDLVTIELAKQGATPSEAIPAKVAPAKKVLAKAVPSAEASKKRGRPSKK